jgi:divalent metal cation (Fe/Co/Zn/Cd) transporter
MHVVVEPDMSVREAHQIATQIEEQVKQEFDEVAEIKVRIEPHGSMERQGSKNVKE